MSAAKLALSHLLHDRGRSAVSVIGTIFAVILIFMQLGFLGAVRATATLLYDRLSFDILLTSQEYVDFTRPGTITRERLAQARAHDAVSDVIPMSVGQGVWRNPTNDPIRGQKRWQLTILGTDPSRLDRVFEPQGTGVFGSTSSTLDARLALSQSGMVYLDRRSRKDFGDAEQMPAGATTTDVNGQRVDLAGYFELGTGFSYSGLLLTSEETFGKLSVIPTRQVTLGLITVRPDQDVAQVADQLRVRLPSDTRIFTRGEINALEVDYWVNKTAVGILFLCGVGLAFVVGAIFVYQMMVADIKKHLPEYATLKAVGYSGSYLFAVVIWQALFLACVGYLGALAICIGLYEVARDQAMIPIGMTVERLWIVLVITVSMCVGSGLIAVRKARTADPADLF